MKEKHVRYNTPLRNIPENVTGYFYCDNDKLTSLKGSPKFIGVNFNCYRNYLTSLKGGPKIVGNGIYCYDNKLTCLIYSPKTSSFIGFRRNNILSTDYIPYVKY